MTRMESGMHHGRRATALRLATIIALLVLLAACGQQNLSADEYIEQAREHRADGELRSAIIQLRNALQQEPDNAEARALLGQSYLALEDMASAEKELRRALEQGAPRAAVIADFAAALLGEQRFDRLLAIEIDPDWPEAVRVRVHALRGRAHLAEGRAAPAEDEFERADAIREGELHTYLGRVELAMARRDRVVAARIAEQATEAHPDRPQVWRAMSRVALARGEVEAAEMATSRAIERTENPAEDYLTRARIRIRNGNVDDARADLDAIGRRAQGHPQVVFLRGLAAWVEEDFAEACERMQQAVADAPEFAEARFHLGVCHLHNGEFNQAEAHLRWVTQRTAEPQATRLLGVAQLALGQHERARQTVRPLVQQYPEDVEAVALLGQIEMDLGNTSAAIEHMQRLVQLRPDDAELQYSVGTGLMQTGQTGAGREAISQALQLDPGLDGAGSMLVLSHLQAGEYEQALEAARQMIAANPGAALPWSLKGIAHIALKEEAAAREAFDQALERDPGDPASHHYMARMARDEGDVDTAREHYEAVLNVHPEHGDTLLALAELEAGEGNRNRARELLHRAHEADPDALRPRLSLAQQRMEQGDPQGALELVAGVDGRVPRQPLALEIAGRASLALDDPDASIEHFEVLAAQRPEAAGSHLLLARAYIAAGRGGDALDRLERVLELDPGNVQVLMLKARARVRQGAYDDAREMIARLPDEIRETAYILETRGDLAMGEGDTAAAADYYRRAHEAEPSSAAAVRWSRALFRAGERERALDVLSDWVAERPDDVEALVSLGDLYVRADRDSDAISAYRAALEQAPDSVRALNNLGWLLRDRDSEEALRHARTAVDLEPDSAAIRDTYGMVLLSAGRADAAIEHLERAVDLAPEAGMLRFHLAQALAAAGHEEDARTHLRRALREGDFDGRAEAEALLEELGG